MNIFESNCSVAGFISSGTLCPVVIYETGILAEAKICKNENKKVVKTRLDPNTTGLERFWSQITHYSGPISELGDLFRTPPKGTVICDEIMLLREIHIPTPSSPRMKQKWHLKK